MKTIHKTYEIQASAKDVWGALTEPKIIEQWSGAPAKMSDKKDTKFSLWDGDITGTNLEVEDEKYLKQQWYSSDMEKGTKTFAEFKITDEGDDKTALVLIHSDVPDKSFKSIEQGWDDYYLGPLKNLLEQS